jgi:glycogen operon protein
VIYELHVGGFTQHPSSRAARPGTFSGLAEKIPYLLELGITHVELLPVMAFDEQSVPRGAAARGLRNYWGYNTHSFWSPHPRYCGAPQQGRQAAEFKHLVRALHAAGIGVILDVVFNHTAEGDGDGPWINFRGSANEVLYHLDPRDRRRYLDFTGTGNTLNCNHPLVTAFIVYCLEFWVEEMHVDGFRFDLASVFTRGDAGVVLPNPPLPWDIELSRKLVDIPLIAEAWDAAGLYQVGAFPGSSWAEWNGAYRDAVRRFVRGDAGLTGTVASRIAGSSDLYAHDGRSPCNSINFITCHDGFTLADLVSYNGKHNEANGEDNRDGADDNRSCNWGIEGSTGDATIETLRNRQVKNFLAVTMLSMGMPMILMGDEMRRTQCGNNNAYCQDNQISWLDWSLMSKHADVHRFATLLCKLRLFLDNQPAEQCQSLSELLRTGNPVWHGVKPGKPDWGISSHSLALSLEKQDLLCYFILNAFWESLDFELPPAGKSGATWRRWIDTALDSPEDIVEWDAAPVVATQSYRAVARSVVALYAHSAVILKP